MARGGGLLGSTIVVGLVLSALGAVGLVAGTVATVRGGGPSVEVAPKTDVEHIEIVTEKEPTGDPYGLNDLEWDSLVPEVSDPAADDGELHDAWNLDVSYGIKDTSWMRADTERVKGYGKRKVNYSFVVNYPQLTGKLAHKDQVNELLKATALQTVHTYFEDPSKETVERVKLVSEGEDEIMLSSTVSYAVSYNTEDFLSVCFSDEYYIGSVYAGFGQLRTVNVNLQTGEAYVLDDILTVDENIAGSFVDNLIRTSGDDQNGDGVVSADECLTVKIAGRRALMDALEGKGRWAERVETCFFVDANGKVNLGVTYWVSGDEGLVRGWWDVTITDEQLAAARKDSSFWELIG